MNDRSKFEKDILFSEIEYISRSLHTEIDIFLIGGLAMIHHGLKAVTKDIDIVLSDEQKAVKFQEHLIRNGFIRTDPISSEYRRLEAFSMFERPGGYRFDIFVQRVCGKLTLSEKMKERSTGISIPGKLVLNIVSTEDLFLFKSITGRDDDLADMRMIAVSGLDWSIIDEEMRDQPNSWRWNVMFYQSILALEEEYSILCPLKEKFRIEAEISAGIGIAISKLEEHSISYSHLLEAIDEDVKFSKAVIDRMREIGLIHEENGLMTTPEIQ